jgi:hypothetical protein
MAGQLLAGKSWASAGNGLKDHPELKNESAQMDQGETYHEENRRTIHRQRPVGFNKHLHG